MLFVNGVGMRFDGSEHGRPTRQEPSLTGHTSFHDIESSITRVVGLELYQMKFPTMRGALDLAPTLRQIPEFLTRLRDSFDLVVIASPAAKLSPAPYESTTGPGSGAAFHRPVRPSPPN